MIGGSRWISGSCFLAPQQACSKLIPSILQWDQALVAHSGIWLDFVCLIGCLPFPLSLLHVPSHCFLGLLNKLHILKTSAQNLCLWGNSNQNRSPPSPFPSALSQPLKLGAGGKREASWETRTKSWGYGHIQHIELRKKLSGRKKRGRQDSGSEDGERLSHWSVVAKLS